MGKPGTILAIWRNMLAAIYTASAICTATGICDGARRAVAWICAGGRSDLGKGLFLFLIDLPDHFATS